MISYFPEIYPDELVYSWLARYYVQSGYMRYTFCAEELYKNPKVKPNIEFINPFTEDAKKVILKNISIQELILKHTMFPLYARFLPKERRQYAYDKLINEQKCDANILPFPKSKDGSIRHLRCCPVCIKEDRERFNEAYWHRSHQLIGVNVCLKHGCKLANSDIQLISNVSPSLISAEEAIVDLETDVEYGDELEIEVAKYMVDVFERDIDFESDIKIGEFLYSKMQNTKYVSIRGKKRNMTVFHSDFIDAFKELKGNWLTEEWQIQKILNDRRWSAYEICLIAMFLNISVTELTNMKLPKMLQEEVFDEEVRLLHKQGLSYRQIADRLNASYDLVKSIGCGSYGKYYYDRKSNDILKSRKKDWESIDNERLPKVKEAIYILKGSETIRPKRINQSSVEKLLELKLGALNNCPKCMNEINNVYQTQEEYWTLEVVWAIEKLIKDGKLLNWTNVQKLTNMRKTDLERCYGHICMIPNDEMREIINML